MTSVRKEEFLLTSAFGNQYSIDQNLDIRIPHMSGIAPLVFRAYVSAPSGLTYPNDIPHHTVLVQRDPMYLLAAYQIQARVNLRAQPGNANAQPQYLNAFRFQSLPDGTTYRVDYVSDGVFYNEQHQETVELEEGADESLAFQVYREGDTRVFAARTTKGTNKIALPSDLWPFISRINEQKEEILPQRDLAEAVKFSTYNL